LLSTPSNNENHGPRRCHKRHAQKTRAGSKTVLLKLMNSSWRRGIVPQVWKEAKMVPIPKQGKDKLHPNSYRPISLLSCVCKLMERIINSRLMWHLEEKRLLLPQQAGFRKYMSTEDQVATIAQGIDDAFQEESQTVAVWVDMEKAFDKVWHDGLRLGKCSSG
jgi:hypothetical protein